MTKITDVIFVFVITFRDVSCRNEMTSMSDLKRPFFPPICHQCSCSFKKVKQHSIKVNHSTAICIRSFLQLHKYNIYESSCWWKDYFTVSSPPSPAAPSLSFSFVVLFFCGLILMKSLVVKSLGIRRAFNLYSVVNNGVNCSEWTSWRH